MGSSLEMYINLSEIVLSLKINDKSHMIDKKYCMFVCMNTLYLTAMRNHVASITNNKHVANLCLGKPKYLYYCCMETQKSAMNLKIIPLVYFDYFFHLFFHFKYLVGNILESTQVKNTAVGTGLSRT